MASLEAERVRANLRSKLFGAGPGSIKVGRFELGPRIGSGGMGVVYRARDPELERDVAVKILRTEAKPERLLAEARAMARLEHPNVVGVYEAGTSDGRSFVAMELVRGQSLGAWLEERPRTQAEILGVFRSAARGLDAAHRAGIVHRDFKPANVLVSTEGDARVADFGLAGDAPADDEAVSSRAPLSATRGAGTPFYMAPEVLDGGRATPKSDQFAFGVSLYEALTGSRPFEAKSLAELRKAQATQPATPRMFSRALHRTIAKMLSREPDARFGSMAEVADALALRSSRSALAIGALLMGSAAVALFFGLRSSRGAEVCSGSDRALVEAWSDEKKASTEKALASTEAPFAGEATKRTVAALDAYAARWRAAHRDACEAANVRKEQSPAVMDRRMACLQRRKAELDAFVKALAAGGPDVLERAADGVSHLTPVERCADVERLEHESPEPPESAAAQVEAARGAVNEAAALRETGKYPEALARAKEAVAAATAGGFAPATAEAQIELARIQFLTGDPKAAREAALAAADGAEASGADGTSAVAWLVALSSITKGAVKPEDTELFERRARAAIARLGDPSDLLGDLEEIVGARRREDGKHEESLAHHKKELELRIEVYGEGSLAAADARAHIAGALTFLDRVEEGAAEMELALQDAEAAVGSDHPRLAAFLNVQGLNLKSRGRYEESYAALSRALEILERAVGKDSDRLSSTITNLGNACMHLQRLDEARVLHGRAIALKERTYGKDHPTVALALNNLANVEIQAKRFDEAIRLHERGLAIREKALAPDDRMIGMSLTNLGDAYAGSGKYAEATEHYRKSIVIFEKLSGGKHSMLSYPLTGLGSALVELGKPQEAIEPLERALAIRDKDGLARDLAAETRFALARALVAAKKDRERAMRLANEARDELVRGGEKKKVFLAELDAWLSVTK